jgi:predicted GTPase
MSKQRRRVVILGAGGRDFHNFNVAFRNSPEVEVLAFTATQIPGIDDRTYPAVLAGPLYPEGIPIVSEADVPAFLRKHPADEAIFAYSDVSHEYVMQKGSWVMSMGLDYRIMGPASTQIASTKPVISILATRTGSGKSQTTRKVAAILRDAGRKVVAIRHPMPYGDLAKQGVQRFANVEDLARHQCTIEEMEEYEPHVVSGTIIYAGVDYEAILREAEKEADIILWDGGNNDLSFYKEDLSILVADPLRPGHELSYHPGNTNFLRADVIVINKVDSASLDQVNQVRRNISKHNPTAVVVDAASPIFVEDWEKIRGKRVLVVEDGPTLTHGGMTMGAGVVAALKYGAKELVDPRPYLVGEMAETFRKYPGIGTLLPAMGYGEKQIKDMEATIRKVECDLVVIGTPIDFRRVVKLDKDSVRVTYELEEIGEPKLKAVLSRFLERR